MHFGVRRPSLNEIPFAMKPTAPFKNSYISRQREEFESRSSEGPGRRESRTSALSVRKNMPSSCFLSSRKAYNGLGGQWSDDGAISMKWWWWPSGNEKGRQSCRVIADGNDICDIYAKRGEYSAKQHVGAISFMRRRRHHGIVSRSRRASKKRGKAKRPPAATDMAILWRERRHESDIIYALACHDSFGMTKIEKRQIDVI